MKPRSPSGSGGLLPQAAALVVGAVLISVAYKSLVRNPDDEVLDAEDKEDPGELLPKEKNLDLPEPIPTPAEPDATKVETPELKEPKKPEAKKFYTNWKEKILGLFDWKPKSNTSESADTQEGTAPNADRPSDSTQKRTPKSTLSKRPLPEGYRGKFTFPSFPGSTAIATYGSYTQEEANQIIRLKTSKANTSASGGMSSRIKQLIQVKARAYGLNPDTMLKVAAMESGGNPNAISSTGAIGIYQFTGDTASRVSLKNRFDAEANIEAGMILAVKNKVVLDKLGVETSPISLYLTHQLGPTAAKELLIAAKSKKTPISTLSSRTQSAIRKNAGGKSARTAREYVDNTAAMLESKYASLKNTPSTSNTASVEERAPLVIPSEPKVASTVVAPTSLPSARVAPETVTVRPTKVAQVELAEREEPSPSRPPRKAGQSWTEQHTRSGSAFEGTDVDSSQGVINQGKLAYGAFDNLSVGPGGLLLSTT
jgi:hypothetical protein